MPQFALSATLGGHLDDVRSLAVVDNSTIVSGSRDQTLKSWTRSGHQFAGATELYSADQYVNSLALYDDGDEKFVVCGGNDLMVTLVPLSGASSPYCFSGHTANVCALDCKDTYIVSGSWDGTARVWQRGKTEAVHVLKGHEGSVWGVKALGNDEYLTCGADKTIRRWHGSTQTDSWVAHDAVVRDLALLPNGDVASCGNDGKIKIWHGRQCIQTLEGHQSLLYSLCVTADGDLVSCGEDRSVRVWHNGKCVQSIVLPCVSLWKVAAFPNGDIAVGGSDWKIRVFTRAAERKTDAAEIAELRDEVASSSVSERLYGRVVKERLPKQLPSSGAFVGQTAMIVGEIGTVELYQWTASAWEKIGEVAASSSNRKQQYNGKAYDYVFDVDIEDGKPPLKLACNISDNPYEVADAFLAANNLPYSYVQEIVNFILRNAEGIKLDNKGESKEAEPEVGATPSVPSSSSSVIPQTTYLSFTKFEVSKVVAGFRKLNAKQSTAHQLDARQFETLINTEDYNGLARVAEEIIDSWEGASKLIGFDILRVVIHKIDPFDNMFSLIMKGLHSDNLKIKMLAVRTLVNVFSTPVWGEPTFMDAEVFDVVFTSELENSLKEESSGPGKKVLAISVATLLLDYCVLIYKNSASLLYQKCAEVMDQYVPALLVSEESSYRMLVGINTLRRMQENEVLAGVAATIEQTYTSARFQQLK